MTRRTPPENLRDFPCSICAVACAIGHLPMGISDYLAQLKSDGYATLNVANRFIRTHLDIKKRTNYKRGQRPKLKDLHLDGKAVVCVYGHLVYVDHEDYWSFFENENDYVVAVWEIK